MHLPQQGSTSKYKNQAKQKGTIPTRNVNSPSHQRVHAPLSCSCHLVHPSLSFNRVQVINLTAHSHCPLFMQDGNTAFDIANIEGHTDVCQELLTQQSS